MTAGAGAAEPSATFESVVAPSGPADQRNSESDILPLNGGRLLLAWSEYSSPSGFVPADLPPNTDCRLP